MSYKKILAITYWGLGDFIWATSAFAIIKKTFPKSELTVLLLKEFEQLAKNNPVIDKYFFYYHSRNDSYIKDRLKKSLWFLRYFLKLVFGGYEACIFFDNSTLLTLIVKMAGIKVIAGPDIRAGIKNAAEPSRKYFTFTARLNPDVKHFHMSQRYQNIARQFLESYNLAKPVLTDTKNLSDKALNLIGEKTGFTVCINYRGQKTLPDERIIEIIKALSSQIPSNFCLLGDKSIFDNSKKIVNSLKDVSIKNLCGKTDILVLKAVLEQSDLLISVDTGTVHLAAAAGIKVISLHGQTLPDESMPVTHKAAALCSYEKCSPCSYAECPNGLKCLYNISVKEICETAKILLNEKSE
ncbi:MAG: glycosyltransferase family 9 protein [Endomicrobia bacterium]|nr:glycosyltransferase family 9 protein [Endomicrobiia bacterium]MCL2799005.1 glycosyltransferase family 9 protein [Endomicrobiia bacterium]